MESIIKRAMPWLGDEICIKDSQTHISTMPGLNLVQWMIMQRNPQVSSMAVRQEYVGPLSSTVSTVLQGYGNGTDLSKQIGWQCQILQQSGLQFNPSKMQQPQQIDQLQKLPPTMAQHGSVNHPQQQQQVDDFKQQQQQKQQILPTQSLLQNSTRAQALQPRLAGDNHLQKQQQILTQNQQSVPGIIQNQRPQHQGQQQIAMQGQHQNAISHQSTLSQNPAVTHQISQHLQQSEQQIQLQLLQKIQQQQQQSLLPQGAIRSTQSTQLHDQHRQLLSEAPQQLTQPQTFPQQKTHVMHVQQQQGAGRNLQAGVKFTQAQRYQLPRKLQQEQSLPPVDISGLALPSTSSFMSTSANSIVANGTPSVITDDVPSCFTSPSTNNGPLVNQPAITKNNRSSGLLEEMRQSVATVLNHAGVLVSMADGNSLAKVIPRPEVKPSLPDTKLQNEVPQTCLGPAQIDHVDTSSSGTSACISQTDVALQQNFAPPPYYTSSLMFRDTSQDEVQTDPQNNTLFGVNIDGQLGIPLTPEPSLSRSLDPGKDSQNQVSAGPTLSNYSNPKEIQPELSSSMVYQSFGVPSVAFNSGVSVDSGMNDDSFLNRGSWIQPRYQRMRTFTKVDAQA